MRIVHVVQHVEGKNLAPARDFGDISIILNGKETTAVAVHKLETALQNFKADDYLLLIGHPVNIAIAAQCVFAKWPVVNFLVWERDRFCYRVETVAL